MCCLEMLVKTTIMQGNAATDLMTGGSLNSKFIPDFNSETIIKRLFYICQNYCKNKSGTLFL